MKMVQVIWTDSRRYIDEMTQEEAIEDTEFCTMRTAGWLLGKSNKQIVIAQDINDVNARGVLVIPKENIVELNELNKVKKK